MRQAYIVRPSKIHGKGIFALNNVKKGDVIFKLPGVIVHREIKNEKESWRFVNWIEIAKNTWINPNRTSVRNFNHSCDPNAIITPQHTVRAIKPIAAGDEITFDYSLTDTDTYWKVACKCGAKRCRKVIGSVQSLPTRAFKAKRSYIPPYARVAFNIAHKHEAISHR